MTSKNTRSTMWRIRRYRILLWLGVTGCLLLATTCDIAPPSPPTPPATERPVATEPQPILQTSPSPWDVSWVPEDSQAVASRIDSLLDGTGLAGHGGTILEYAREYGVNPAFALAMFRKEAEFAKQGSIAQRQNNPGNIICSGGTTPLYGATDCGGRFGTYDTMADGIRAYFWLLDSEYKPGRRYNCEEIACVIAVYCPPSDCDTDHYVDQVTAWTTQYQSRLSAGSPLVLEPGPTVPSMAVTVLPATVIPVTTAPVASPTATPVVGGGRIAFQSWGGGDYEVYVMNPDGSGQANLTNNPAGDGRPSWSPDGTRIAFQSTRDGNYEIYVMNADGSEVIRLTDHPATDWAPSWSPDGRRIAFMSERGGDQEIYVMNVDGSALCNITNNPSWDGFPSWSLDAMRIVFESDRDGPGTHIYTMNADGSGVVRLTSTAQGGVSPSWSRDGAYIVFASGDIEISKMNSDGSGLVRLTNNPSYDQWPCWSPDGTQIAFVSDRDGNDEIYVMNADGTGVERVTNNPGSDRDPCWSPR